MEGHLDRRVLGQIDRYEDKILTIWTGGQMLGLFGGRAHGLFGGRALGLFGGRTLGQMN